MQYRETYQKWLDSPVVDAATKEELRAIANDEKEIKERFYKDLEFGTGGLRGIIAAGSNRMNIYTVRKATQGLAEDILNCGEQEKGVVIAYDSRHKSYDFAIESAKVLAANGIKAYVFDELRPTPELSFAVRYLKAARGIVITASHNPKEYNAYKAYGEDGGQLPPKSSDYVIGIIESIDIFDGVKVMDEQAARGAGLLVTIGKDVDDAFLSAVRGQSINEENFAKLGDGFKVIYTPFHGTGNKPVRRILEMTGVKNVSVVKEQELPDPDFSTVKSPNPEEKEGFSYAIEMAKQNGADLIFATDPDCDRIGVVTRNKQGEYVTLSGNQTGVLLTEFILRNKKQNGTLPDNGAVIKTIVTTPMVEPIAKAYGVKVYDVLTGFKFIGELIRDFEENGYYSQYLFGFEESYGYLAGTYARDKDAVVASMLVCQMAADYKVRGMTLYEGLLSLYETYGYYQERLKNIVLTGMDGVEKIRGIMESFRANPPKELDGSQVTEVWDVQAGTAVKAGGTVAKLDLPKSNVLKFFTADGAWIAMRPSGTEPKIKFYFGVCEQGLEAANAKLDRLEKKIQESL